VKCQKTCLHSFYIVISPFFAEIRQRFSRYLNRQKAKTESQPNLPQSSSSSGVGGSDRQHNLLAARDIHHITGQMHHMHIVKQEEGQVMSEEEKQWLAAERARKIIADLGEEEMQSMNISLQYFYGNGFLPAHSDLFVERGKMTLDPNIYLYLY
jgi:hypothetical protein